MSGPYANQLLPPAAQAVAEALASGRLFTEYAPRVYHLARRLLGNDADAEDVTQQVFLQVVRKVHTFRGDSAFSTWLNHLTVREALTYRGRRSLSRQRELSLPAEEFDGEGHHAAPVRRWRTPESAAIDQETHDQVEKAIAGLPEIYRDVFVLVDVEELSNPEVAQLLGLSLPAVKSRLHRARLLMRRALAPYFEERAA